MNTSPVEDIVLMATRIEELNKNLGTRILLSEDVIKKLDFFLTRELGKFILPKRPEPVTVHELLCLKEDSSQQQRSLCVSFSEALDAFKKQSWEEASEKFLELIKRIWGRWTLTLLRRNYATNTGISHLRSHGMDWFAWIKIVGCFRHEFTLIDFDLYPLRNGFRNFRTGVCLKF